jgi:hypothetical protein
MMEQVESPKTQGEELAKKISSATASRAQTQKRALKQSVALPPIPFDDVVTEIKRIVAVGDSNDWRLGELADRCEPKYGDKTLAKLAKAIGGIAACTLERRRSVYRRWKEIPAAPPKSFAVAQELAAHPDRGKIIEEKPNITTREARKLMSEWNEEQQKADPDHQQKRMEKLLEDLLLRASKAVADAGMINTFTQEERRNLQKAIKEPKMVDDELREGAKAWIALADFFKRLVDEASDKASRKSPPPKAAA